MMGKIAKQFDHEYLLFIVGVAITLFNTVNLQQNSVLIVTIPQYILVFYNILQKKYQWAFLLHSFFISACVSGGIVIDGGVSPFLYIKMTLYGPLTFNIIILAALWIGVYKQPIKINKKSLVLKVRKTILYLLISGVIVGFIGCVFNKFNDWHYWIVQTLFVGEVFLSLLSTKIS